MRLHQNEIDTIDKVIAEIFGDAQVYLFGSRLDDTKKGGDIDLFIISSETNNLVEKKIKSIARLQRILNKPVDILLHRDFSRPMEQEATKGILLKKKS